MRMVTFLETLASRAKRCAPENRPIAHGLDQIFLNHVFMVVPPLRLFRFRGEFRHLLPICFGRHRPFIVKYSVRIRPLAP